MNFQLYFDGAPAQGFSSSGIEGNIQVGPSTVEILRQMVASLEGDTPARAIFAGILTSAADELEAANKRIAELIDAMPT
jgi:hypothetical protein